MDRVLIAEDQPRLAARIEDGLRAAGYATSIASNGAAALDAAHTGRFELLVLDLGLAAPDGLTVLRRLRAAGCNLAVIALTAPSEALSAVRALDRGADDLLARPFSVAQLLDRIRAQLVSRGRPVALTIEAGDATLDLQQRTVSTTNGQIDLTPRELALAEILFRNAGRALTRQQLLDFAWDCDFEPASNVVDVYVGYLRRKLGRSRIRSVRGVGYRLEAIPPE